MFLRNIQILLLLFLLLCGSQIVSAMVLWTAQSKMVATGGLAGDQYGYAVYVSSVDGLGAVGVPYNDDKGIDSGAETKSN